METAGTEKQPKRLSGNVQRLRFMRTSANALARKEELSAAARIEPAWVVDVETFNSLTRGDIPKPFLESEVTERIPLRQQHRRSYQGYNPATEKFYKVISVKIKRQRTEAEDQSVLKALSKR